MGDWCGSNGGPNVVADLITGPSPNSDAANPKKILGARRGIAGNYFFKLFRLRDKIGAPRRGVFSKVAIDGGLLMGDPRSEDSRFLVRDVVPDSSNPCALESVDNPIFPHVILHPRPIQYLEIVQMMLSVIGRHLIFAE
jgi:hypothetical protein